MKVSHIHLAGKEGRSDQRDLTEKVNLTFSNTMILEMYDLGPQKKETLGGGPFSGTPASLRE